MNDDNSQMKFEQDQQQEWEEEWENHIQRVKNANSWHEKNHLILDGFNKVRPLIQGKKNDQARNNECAKTPF